MHYYLAYWPEHFYTGHISTRELTHENKTIYRLILMTHTYTPIKNFFELPIPSVSNHELWVNLALIIQNKPVYSQINSAIRFFLAGYSLVVDSTCTSKVGSSHSWLAASHSMYWKALPFPQFPCLLKITWVCWQSSKLITVRMVVEVGWALLVFTSHAHS